MGPDEPFDPDEPEGDVRVRRPVVFPLVTFPARLVDVAPVALTGAALLAVLAAAVRALTYREPNLNGGLLGPPGVATFVNHYGGFANRLDLFVTSGATISVAVMVLLAVVISTLNSDPGEDQLHSDRRRYLAYAAAAIGVIVVIANLVFCVEVLASAPGDLVDVDTSSKAASVLSFLAPAVIAAAASLYTFARYRSRPT